MQSLRTALLVSTILATPSAALAEPATAGRFLNGRPAADKFVGTVLLDSTSVGGATPIAPWMAGSLLAGIHVEPGRLAGWIMVVEGGPASNDVVEDRGWVWTTGTGFQGTRLAGEVVDLAGGEPELVTLHIDLIEPAAPDGDLLLHWVSVHTYDDHRVPVTYPLCEDTAGNPLPAILLRGEWNPDQDLVAGDDQISDDADRGTFACTSDESDVTHGLSQNAEVTPGHSTSTFMLSIGDTAGLAGHVNTWTLNDIAGGPGVCIGC